MSRRGRRVKKRWSRAARRVDKRVGFNDSESGFKLGPEGVGQGGRMGQLGKEKEG